MFHQFPARDTKDFVESRSGLPFQSFTVSPSGNMFVDLSFIKIPEFYCLALAGNENIHYILLYILSSQSSLEIDSPLAFNTA